MSWMIFATRFQARRYAEAQPLVDDIDVTFDQPGWYWCERVDDPIGDCMVSRTYRIVPAAQRVGELREQIAELDTELKAATRRIEGGT